MTSIKFAILHSKVYEGRRDNLVSTWLSGQDYLFYGDYSDKQNKVIKVSDNSSYHSNEEKFVNIFNSLDYTNHDWIMFVDDDTFINIKVLYEKLEDLNRSTLHGQKINCWPNDPSLYYLSGGAGILIHKDMYSIYKGKLVNYNTGYSDVSLGIFLRQKNIPISGSDLFHSQPPEYYATSWEDLVKRSISFHYIKSIEHHQQLMKISRA